MITYSNPHIWLTTDADGSSCRHIAMGTDGAYRAHLLHFGLIGCSKNIEVIDEGMLRGKAEIDDICLDKGCVLCGLSFGLEDDDGDDPVAEAGMLLGGPSVLRHMNEEVEFERVCESIARFEHMPPEEFEEDEYQKLLVRYEEFRRAGYGA